MASLDNTTIRTAVNDWIAGGPAKTTVITTYGQINNWDTSEVTDMSLLFKDKLTFNDDISDWDTSEVTIMRNMFDTAKAFNQDISDWDTSEVTDMKYMFIRAENYNNNGNPLNRNGNKWNTENVTTMTGMFETTNAFNQDIGNWDTSNVEHMTVMFYEAKAFNQDIGNWDTSNVTTMRDMFRDAIKFNQEIRTWNVNSVTDNFRDMFLNATDFITKYGAETGFESTPDITFWTSYSPSLPPPKDPCPCPKPALPGNPLGINFGGTENRPGFLMTQPFIHATNIRNPQCTKPTFANIQLNAFGKWSGGPRGSGAPPRNKFG